MADASPVIAPAPIPASHNNLAPPQKSVRSNSAASNRSRRGRSHGTSSVNLSRSNSHSSRGGGTSDGTSGGGGDKTKKSGHTTTISGGTSLGISNGDLNTKKPKGKKDASATTSNEKEEKADNSKPKQEKQEKQDKRRASSNNQNRRPQPINTAPARTNSRNSTNKSTPANEAASQTQTAPAPRAIHASVSAPLTALDAAKDVAQQKQASGASGGDALASLQKMISDLKSMPASSGNSSGGSAPASRSASGQREPMTGGTSPVPISASLSRQGSKKLKADAPSFTPSFNPSSASPGGSHMSISPAAQMPTSFIGSHPRTGSHSTINDRRASSPSGPHPLFPGLAGMSPYNQSQSFGYQNLGLQGSDLDGYGQAQPFDYQQLLAAQQLQYHQIQLLQAQLAASQLAAQQAQQQQQIPSHQQMGSFIAPRFQALAAQRAQQQQQQQAQQLAQAQQLFELQQQQLATVQRRSQEEQARALAQATLHNPPPVFEEDSPEKRTVPLVSNRPQLAPSFKFGAKKMDEISDRQASISPPLHPPIINRSEGIGGAAAAGLAGLAARAHKRTGSELSAAMQQQLEIQSQIEALQAKQKALMQEDLASQGETPLSQLNSVLKSSSAVQPVARHRRVQSSVPSASLPDTFGSLSLSNVPESAGHHRSDSRGRAEMPPPPVPMPSAIGHSRRHSVNTFNKSGSMSLGMSIGGDIPEDGIPDGVYGHHRSGSRSGMESGSWRSNSISQSGGMGAGSAGGVAAVSDLAAAQAQLQSLAQFRAAAGGGHSKMASFSFPNMLPNLLAATTLSTPAGQSLWQQQQAFQMQLQSSSSGPQRKSLFAPYLPQASLPPLLSAGKLVVGVLRVNKKNRSDAYVATDVLEADIYICGSKDRNRALEGDIVAVELLDVDEVWSTKKDKEEKKRKKEENAAYDLKPSQAKKLEKKKDDVEVEGQGLTLFEDEEVNDDTKPTYAGHVVAVVERMPGQLFSGQLGVLRPSSAATKEKQELERREREGDRARREETQERPKIVWFRPTDKRVPLIAIPTEQAPSDFIENPDDYSEKLFVATIKRWPITSLHPFGTLVEELGPIGDREVETSALLKDCNFPTEEFPEAAIKCLPPLPWTIPEREYEIRKDLREERIFTIDPPTARDLDDALSVKRNDDGTYEVGVHIADVSYFVKANTALDREARKRATSVYLVQRSVPMLPPQLSEELCSLQPGVERLTFSEFFTLDQDGTVLKSEMSRTIIKSCAKFAYSDAQDIIAGGSLDSTTINGPVPAQKLHNDIVLLHEIASKLRQKRIESGAMLNNRVKVSISLDDDGEPVDCVTHPRTDANSLVEEDGFIERAKKLGFAFDGSTAGTLQKGFDEIQDADTRLCLELLKRRAMQTARYFCTGMLDIAKYYHWALATPLYTHFTSPIRRYADILVHRMLDACLTSPSPNDVKFLMDRDQVAKCAQQCNMKKQSAKLAEEQSIHLYLCILIHDLTEKYGPVIRQGRVTGVLDEAFDVVVPEFGIEKRVHVDKMPVDNVVYDEHKDVLSLYWTNQDVLSYLAGTSDDPHLLKIKALGDKYAKETSARDVAGDVTRSRQRQKSAHRSKFTYEGLRSSGGHKIQDIKELMSLPVIITSDMTKSPPVLVVYACNPYVSLSIILQHHTDVSADTPPDRVIAD
ncbi:hypothetical protein BD324DRAFT_649631 [Kockovaella imperatae]|uniref:RNB domain-containing protein n=1 Tax=Kockovaella imperatae TaxID=4999 RepID=A0A1Y1UL78_9TREE|nr:hypothetical protein BD324DRAFT_649631 [Kockovaella imperatae]ORX38254.1 hypothetical protein BD324DRAFT_649631 [Kockovaella imperatae]